MLGHFLMERSSNGVEVILLPALRLFKKKAMPTSNDDQSSPNRN